jgi:hypothetical protein
MNLHASTVAAQPLVFTNMPNVIDSLKRLERIGSEESQTVQKILQAASEPSETVSKYYPASSQDKAIVATSTMKVTFRLGEWKPNRIGGSSKMKSRDLRNQVRGIYLAFIRLAAAVMDPA